MDESITRSAGGVNGQEFDVAAMRALAAGLGRRLEERTTLYRPRLPRLDILTQMETVA
jgi:FO synthase